MAFVNLDDVVGDETVRFAVHSSSRVRVRCLDEAVDGALSLVVPVLLVGHAVLLLNSQVCLVSALDRLGREVGDILAGVHVERHRCSFRSGEGVWPEGCSAGPSDFSSRSPQAKYSMLHVQVASLSLPELHHMHETVILI